MGSVKGIIGFPLHLPQRTGSDRFMRKRENYAMLQDITSGWCSLSFWCPGDCGLPPKLQFASPLNQLYESNFKAGTVLKNACHSGYRRVNSSRVTCGAYGAWIYSIFCIKKQCRNPGELTNGKVDIMTDFLFGSTIQFSCSKGYVLIGSTNSQCEVQGSEVEWSDPLPECVIVKCESPPEISNGRHSGGDEDLYTFGSSVTYSCDPNFSLIGNATIYCMVENKTLGVWRPNPPVYIFFYTPVEIFCHQPQIPKGIFISGFKPFYTHRDSIVISCKKGYVLRGSNLIHCEAHNEWYPSVPTCELTTYECIEGYILVGFAIYNYDQSLSYAVLMPFSEKTQESKYVSLLVLCPKPTIENGRLAREKDHYVAMENITIQCDFGYNMVGSQSITCSVNKTWYPEVPKCKKEVPEGCEQVIIGRKLMQCLPNSEEVKMALQIYKLSLQIERLEQEKDKCIKLRENIFEKEKSEELDMHW
uniref:Sushi domain-containing protein n=1 Tax=Spermophilus dauricus TaxID=99837 RepID=A0A8C9Q1H6_SPEDA